MSGPDEREFFDNLGAAETTPPSHQLDPPPPPSGEFQQTGRQRAAGDDAPSSGPVPAAGPPSGPIQTAGPSSGPNPTAGPPPAEGPSGPAGRGADPTAVMPPGPGASPSPSPRSGDGAHAAPPKSPPGPGRPGDVWSNNAPRYRPAGQGYPPPRPGDPTSQQRAGVPTPRPTDPGLGSHSAPRPQPRTPYFGPGGGELLREQLRANDLIASKKIPPLRGWRKLLYTLSFRAINPGESPDEREVRRLSDLVSSPLRGTYSVAVLGGKGGAGKTTVTAAIGSTFALLRNDKVVAIDADPAQAANLAARVDPTATSSYSEVVADGQLMRYSDMRSHVGQNKAGLDVLASAPHVSGRQAVDAALFSDVHQRLQRFYTLLIADCGVDLDHSVMSGVLDTATAVVMVASAVPDGAEGAAGQMDWLGEAGYHQLMSRLVLVINHIRGYTSRKDRRETEKLVATLVERFGRWVPPERIFVVPFDPHIARAGRVDLDELRPATRRRFLEITAALANGFAATTDTP